MFELEGNCPVVDISDCHVGDMPNLHGGNG